MMTKAGRSALFVLVAVVSAACAGIMNQTTRAGVSGKVKVKTDDFKKESWITGPVMRASLLAQPTGEGHRDNWQVSHYHMRAFQNDKTGSAFLQVYVSHEDDDWLFFDHAVDATGAKVEFNQVNRETHYTRGVGVSVIEDFAITLPETYLRERADKGLQIRVYGKNGRRALNVPPFYLQGFLERYDTFAKK